MRTGLTQRALVLLNTLRRLSATPLSSLLNILVIGIALSFPAGLYLLLQSVHSIMNPARSAAQMSVFLNMDASQADITRIGNQLKQLEGIEAVEFVPRAHALEQLKQSTGSADIIEGLPQNPLPDAFLMQPKKLDLKPLESLRDELLKWPKVSHVQLDSAWAHRLASLLQFGQLAVLILSLLLSMALIAVTFNTIRLQILARREEIEVAALIGATPAFIRRPFVYFGVIQGLLGGLMAWVIILISLLALNSNLATLVKLFEIDFTIALPGAGDIIKLLIFSAVLGGLGAWLSVGQHIKPIEPR